MGYFHTLFNCHLESLLFPSQKIDTEVKNDMTSLSRKKDYCNVTSLAYPRLKKLSEVTTKIEVLSCSTETMFSTIWIVFRRNKGHVLQCLQLLRSFKKIKGLRVWPPDTEEQRHFSVHYFKISSKRVDIVLISLSFLFKNKYFSISIFCVGNKRGSRWQLKSVWK